MDLILCHVLIDNMDNRTLNTTVTYKSNCHYDESSSSAPIILPLRDATISFTLHNSTIDSTTLYYNDVVKVSIFVSDNNNTVQWGNVIFYFIDKDDVTQTKQQINVDPIPIDREGNAAIEYIPHNNGYFVAEYNGDPYYKTITETYFCELLPRPIHVEFTTYAPYLTNPEETVTMEVTVEDEYSNKPLEYGLVTFLNYHAYGMENSESQYEKVIGNPRYLIKIPQTDEDGNPIRDNNGNILYEKSKASITYSPIQLGTNELLNNIELIAAIYNYDNDLYGVKWKYYAQHQDWTSIAIRRDNQINIHVPMVQVGAESHNLTCNDEGLFVIQETDHLLCRCSLILSPNQIVTNTENRKFVSFVVEGHQYSYENEERISNNFKRIFDEVNYIELNEEKYYEIMIDTLPEGLYKIYAQVENPTTSIDGNIVEIPVNVTNVDVENAANLPVQNKDERLQHIKDGIYLKSNVSESFYIKVKPKSNDLELTLSSEQTLLTNRTLDKTKIKCEIGGNLTQDDIHVLTGKKCYFWVSNTGQVYEGSIQYTENKLVAKPNKDITFENIDDYRIFAYILGDTYIYHSGQNTITREYLTTYSNSLLIRTRNALDITLRINTISDIYPGDIKYIINGNNLDIDNIKVEVTVDGIHVNYHELNDVAPMVTDSLPVQTVGTHTLKVEILTEPYTSVSKTTTFTIKKGTLKMSLNTISKNVNTSLVGDIILGIENSNGFDIGTLTQSAFVATLEDSSNNKQQIVGTSNNNSPIQITKMNDKYYQAKVTGALYDDGEWKIKLNYNGDSNYQATNNDYTTFTAFNHKPYCVNISANENKIVNRVVYDQTSEFITQKLANNQEQTIERITYESINQRILVIATISKDGDSPRTIACITNSEGEFTINKPSDMTGTAFTEFDTITCEINPKHNLLNQYSHTTNNGRTAFTNMFSNYSCTTSDMDALYSQAKNNYWVNLFLGYDNVTDTLVIYGDDD